MLWGPRPGRGIGEGGGVIGARELGAPPPSDSLCFLASTGPENRKISTHIMSLLKSKSWQISILGASI